MQNSCKCLAAEILCLAKCVNRDILPTCVKARKSRHFASMRQRAQIAKIHQNAASVIFAFSLNWDKVSTIQPAFSNICFPRIPPSTIYNINCSRSLPGTLSNISLPRTFPGTLYNTSFPHSSTGTFPSSVFCTPPQVFFPKSVYTAPNTARL